MKQKVNKLRYIKVAQGLADNWVFKSFLSLLGSFWATLQDALPVEPVLLVVIIIAIIVDLITGLISSNKKGIKITSFGLRQMSVKVIEYALVILLFTAATNFGKLGDGWIGIMLSPLKNIHYLAYFYVFWTEAQSVYENLGGDASRYRDLWETVKKKIFTN